MKIRTMVYKLKKLLASEQAYVNILKRGGGEDRRELYH